jgi:hypothetical protein
VDPRLVDELEQATAAIPRAGEEWQQWRAFADKSGDLAIEVTDQQDLDYSAGVRIGLTFQGRYFPQLSGVVSRVEVLADRLHVQFVSATERFETVVPGFEYGNIGRSEVIWTIARSAGLPEDRISVNGLDRLPLEDIEIAVPIRSLHVDRGIQVGECMLLPVDNVAWATSIYPDSEMSKAFRSHSAFAVTQAHRRYLYDAEREGLAQAEVAAAWVTTRFRYGAAKLPGGEIQAFDRGRSRVIPTPGSVVAVRALPAGRQWLRTPNFSQKEATVELSDIDRPTDEMTTRDREALRRSGVLWEQPTLSHR